MKKRKNSALLFLRTLPSHVTKSILLLGVLALAIPSFSQNGVSSQRKELEKKRKELVEKIQTTKKVLEENKSKQKVTLTQLKTIGRQIKTRENIINNVQQEINVLSQQIVDSRKVLDTLKADLQRLKEDYGQNILGAYKARNVYDKMMFVFASNSFNQALKRLQYLNQYSDFRKQQAELMLRTQKQMIEALNQMIAIKQDKIDMIGLKENEKLELEKDKEEENRLLSSLQEREGELRKQLAENERSARKLNRAIEELIAKEIEAARRKEEEARRREAAAAAAKKTPGAKETPKTETKAGEMYLTPDALKLSNDFESNKNNLPWPVEKGYITEEFGTHPHPSLKGVMVNNNGVNISTQPGASVRTVFKGKVKNIFSVPGMGRVVLINHGKYFTAYAKLATVSVKEGQEVDTKDVIGTVLTDEEQDVTEVHFEIWNMDKKTDPELWLKN